MNNEEEGTIVLDPELKKEQEKKQALEEKKLETLKIVNTAMNDFVEKASKDLGLKIYIAVSIDELDEIGIWKSPNMSQLDELGMVKMVSTQF